MNFFSLLLKKTRSAVIPTASKCGGGVSPPLSFLLLSLSLLHPTHADTSADAAWSKEMPKILSQITPPTFPNKKISITEQGAVADGKTLNTKAIADTINLVAKNGGGTVVIPNGKFFTGPIHLQSNVHLHLEDNAELIFSDDFHHYEPNVLVRVGGVEIYNYSPLIYARDCTNIAITGKGKLNGNATKWWAWAKKETQLQYKMAHDSTPLAQRIFGKESDAIRPNFLVLVNCKNILLENFTITSSPNWTVHPIYCENATIRKVQVHTDGPNNDGIDLDSCKNILVDDCEFDTGDDCLVLKSGYDNDGWRVAKPTENIIMKNCHSKRGHGGLVIGSEMSGDVRNVFMTDCNFTGTDRAVRIKSRPGRGGVVEKIYAKNIQVKDMKYEAVILNMDYSADPTQIVSEHLPKFRDMCFENFTGTGAPAAVRIRGMKNSVIENIRFENFSLTSDEGVIAEYAENISFDNMNLKTKKQPVFQLKNVSNVRQGPISERSVPFNIQSAIDAAIKNSGGIVTIPEGRHTSGPLTLGSNINLHLTKNAVLVMSNDEKDFPANNGYRPAFISAKNAHDVKITGEGTIEGQGEKWWSEFKDLKNKGTEKQAPRRPQLISFQDCERVEISDITTHNPPNTHYSFKRCRNLTIRGIKAIAPDDSPNTDALNISSAWNVLIENCEISTGDDNIVFLCSSNKNETQAGVENVLVKNCKLGFGHGLSIGSFTGGGLKNIKVENVTFDGTTAGIRMKADRDRGGIVENISYKNISMKNVRYPIFITSYYPKTPDHPSQDNPYKKEKEKHNPIWQNILLENITAENCANSLIFWGLPDEPIQNVTLKNLNIAAKDSAHIYHAENVQFINSNIKSENGAAIKTFQAKVQGMQTSQETSEKIKFR